MFSVTSDLYIWKKYYETWGEWQMHSWMCVCRSLNDRCAFISPGSLSVGNQIKSVTFSVENVFLLWWISLGRSVSSSVEYLSSFDHGITSVGTISMYYELRWCLTHCLFLSMPWFYSFSYLSIVSYMQHVTIWWKYICILKYFKRQIVLNILNLYFEIKRLYILVMSEVYFAYYMAS